MLFVDAKTWSCRPSELMALDDEYVAYCFDQAVGYIGRSIEAELDKVEAKTPAEGEQKRKMIFAKFFDEVDKPTRGLYADPAMLQ
jgi:hypothetical protein